MLEMGMAFSKRQLPAILGIIVGFLSIMAGSKVLLGISFPNYVVPTDQSFITFLLFLSANPALRLLQAAICYNLVIGQKGGSRWEKLSPNT